MGDELNTQINVKEFYEADALRHNIWHASNDSDFYFAEMIRYVKLIELLSGIAGTVLDLGAGDGYLSYLLSKRKYHVVAFDISSNRLAKFGNQARAAQIEQILGHIDYLPFKSASFDCVIASELIEHLPKYEKSLSEVNRILKSNGAIIISVPYKEKLMFHTCPYCMNRFHVNGHFHSFDEVKLSIAVEEAGFKVEKIVLFRSLITTIVRRGFRLRFGRFVKTLDDLVSRIWENDNLYIGLRARKGKQMK
jgi:ubiquinone/menaquinone biosynthesis C-methylase UbiE